MEQKAATRCAEQLVRYPGVWPRWHPCTRKGVVEEDGNKWCKQHAPSSVKARRKASSAKFKADQDRRLAPYNEAKRLEALNAKLLKALEPFADIASQFEDLDDDFPVDCVDLGECRRARDAIEEARK